MKTNSRIKNNQVNPSPTNGTAPASSNIPNAGNLEPIYMNTDYSKMYAEVDKIKDPVSFDELKAFYNMP